MISSSSTIKIRYIVIPSLCSTHCLLLSANAAGNSIYLKSTQESLSDKMCECMFFLFRKSKLLFTKFDTLHQKSHISGEYTHGLHYTLTLKLCLLANSFTHATVKPIFLFCSLIQKLLIILDFIKNVFLIYFHL